MRVIFAGFFILLVFSYSFSLAQAPGVKWSRPLGGTSWDWGSNIQKTSDGGFLFAGVTSSNDKDVVGNHSDSADLWVVKLNSLGQIQWQKCFGGSFDESFGKMICNPDGTAVLIGTSNSSNGDVSGAHGGNDIWVLKIDGLGSILWKRTLGGSSIDEFKYADFTNDNGYIITGYTWSFNGDFTGNHGGEDVWVVKLSSSGTIEWKKMLGGSASDRPNFIMQNADGNYILMGSTASSNGDVSNFHGDNDLWIVKLSPTGSILWAKTYGGSSFETGLKGIISNDGTITVLASTYSIDGDVTGRSITSTPDTWVLNLNYTNGNVNWQKCIGGTLIEMPLDIFKDADDMILVSSSSTSTDGDAIGNHGSMDVLLTRLSNNGSINWTKCFGGPSEDGTRAIYNDVVSRSYVFVANTYGEGGDVSGFHTNLDHPADLKPDAWVVKIRYDGSVEWQRCLGGTSRDEIYSIEKVSENLYVLAGTSQSNNGNVFLNRGGFGDGWAVLMGPVNTITGTLFIDNNLNGIKDVSEPLFSSIIVKSKKVSDSVVSIPYNGLFINEVDTGTYVTTLTSNLPYYTVVPSSSTSSFSTYFNKDSFSFALQPLPNKQDLYIFIVPINAARPGFTSSYRVFYRNEGTTTISSGEILFKKDSRTTLSSSSRAVTTTNGDTLKWNYTNLAPGDTSSILINFSVSPPPAVNNGDTLSFKAIITPVAGDETPSNDTAILKQRVVGSFDPNDKTENNGGVVSSSFVTNGDYLQYTVRFQNTGTAEAYFITVRDTLGNRVDLNTLEVITASHPYTLTIENGNQLIWQFDNIMLPASSVDEAGSHGYIVYRIRPKTDVAVGETIHNTASIYFDYNLPVLTNDALTLVQDNSVILPIQLLNFTGQLTNNIAQLNWKIDNGKNFEKFEIERSLDGKVYSRIETLSFNSSISDYHLQDNVSAVQSKLIFYRLKMIDVDGKFTYSKVIVFRTGDIQSKFSIYPNPARTEVFVSVKADNTQNLILQIVDASGRVVSEQRKGLQKGTNVFPVNTSTLKSGHYILQTILDGEMKTSKLTIMN